MHATVHVPRSALLSQGSAGHWDSAWLRQCQELMPAVEDGLGPGRFEDGGELARSSRLAKKTESAEWRWSPDTLVLQRPLSRAR